MPKTLKSKVSLIYGSLVGILILLGVYSIFSMVRISREVDGLIVTNYNSIQRLDHMQRALDAQNEAILQYFYTQNAEEMKSAFWNADAEFQENYKTEYGTIIIPKEMEMISRIRSEYEDYTALFMELTTIEGTKEAYQFYRLQVDPRLRLVRKAVLELVSSNETALFARKQEAKDVVQHSIYMLTILFFLSGGISFLTFRMYTQKLFRPLYEITQNLKAVRQGNMNRKSSVRTQDELGSLANEFNNMTQRLMEFERSTMGELIAERNRTLAIVRSITEPMVILDREMRVTLMNASFETMFGVTTQEASGRHLLEIIWQSGLAPFAKVNYKVEAYAEKVVELEQGDETKSYNVTVTPLPQKGDEAGPDAAIIILYDITALKELDRMRSDFIATISHEFKTPLTSVIIGADLLAQGALGALNEDQQEVISTLREDGERLSNLVSDLLDLSKIESSKTIYQFERCSVRQVVETSLRQFRPLARQNGVAIEFEEKRPSPDVRADLSKITWVLNNLLSNAVKYTREGDSITVHVLSGRRYVTVEVEDTGIGIPKEYLERIFDKYVQVGSYDLELRGSGLGLAVSRSIIQEHGGKIWCESDLDQGSKFIFTLPVYQEEDAD